MVRRKLILVSLLLLSLAACKQNDLLDSIREYHQLAITVAPPQFSKPEGIYNNDFVITMTSESERVSFRYTVDGSTPRADYGTEYAGAPISITSTTTLKAVAYRPSDVNTSVVATAHYTMQVCTPTQSANPPGGTYSSGTDVTITLGCETSGWSMHYTPDDSVPTSATGTSYAGPFTIKTTSTIKAIAFRTGYVDSNVGEATYSIGNASPPVITPNGGSFSNDQSFSMTCGTPNVTIRYTTDGNDPTPASLQYTGPISVTASLTLKAVAYHSILQPSSIASAIFTMLVAAPSFGPGAGHYNTNQSVQITSGTIGAEIRYTTDGSTPSSTVGTVFSTPVPVTTTTTLKAIAYKTGWTTSAVSSADYVYPCATPAFSPVEGTYNNNQSVSISTTTPGASIRYTTNGTTPSSTVGTLYSSPVAIGATTTLKAIAYNTGWDNSSVRTGTYTLVAATPTISPNGGTYYSAQSITLSSATSGVSIRYTTDGSTPTSSSGNLYSAPFTLAGCTTLRAIAYKTGYSNSSVASAAFHIAIVVDNTGTGGQFCAIGAYGLNVYIAHYDNNFSKSTNYGDSWASGSFGSSKAAQYIDMHVDSSFITLSYYDPINKQIRCAISGNEGGSFNESMITDVGTEYSSVTRYGSAIHVSYQLKGVALFYARSTDNGKTWSPAEGKVDAPTSTTVGLWSSISAYGSTIYISYYDQTNGNLKLAKSTNGGTNWGAPVTVSITGDVGRYTTVFTPDGTAVSIIYYDVTNGDLKLARSADGGSTWNFVTIDSTGNVGQYASAVPAAPGVAYVSYYDATKKYLKVAKTTDYGTTWSSTTVAATKDRDIRWTSIAVSGSNVYVSYFDYANNYLWFTKSLDGGTTW